MREICASGSVGGEGGNALAYPAGEELPDSSRWPDLSPFEGRPTIGGSASRRKKMVESECDAVAVG
jgi:hypothetical protein